MDPLLVSFIIPVLNGEKHIARCLTSILNQNFQGGNYEIIVVDNGSTDQLSKLYVTSVFSSMLCPGLLWVRCVILSANCAG